MEMEIGLKNEWPPNLGNTQRVQLPNSLFERERLIASRMVNSAVHINSHLASAFNLSLEETHRSKGGCI